MAPRIAPAEPTGHTDDIQSIIDLANSDTGGAVNVFLTLAHHPSLLRKWIPFGGKLLFGGSLPARERELMILRTAWVCRSDYEWGQHVRIGEQSGLSSGEIARVPLGARAEGWTDSEADVLEATDQLLDDHTIDDDLWDRLTARYDTKQILELTMVPGHYAMLAGTLRALGVEREDGVPGLPQP